MKKKHPARLIALGVGVVLVGFAVARSGAVNVSLSYKGANLLDKPVPTFNLPALDGSGRVRCRRLAGQVGDHELLKLLAHPVPAGAAAALGVLRVHKRRSRLRR